MGVANMGSQGPTNARKAAIHGGEACCGEWEPKQDEEGIHAGWLSSVGGQCAQDDRGTQAESAAA